MIIKRKSILSGQVNEMQINCTADEIRRWYAGELIQVVMPHLTPDEREFIMTGITAEEWEKTFSQERSENPNA